MSKFKTTFLQGMDFLIKANFIIAMILVIYVAFLAMTDETLLSDDSEYLDLYGPLASNLQLILVYSGIAQINLTIYCRQAGKQPILLGVGLFYLLMVGSLEFYSYVNQIPIDADYGSFLLYQGISDILFGGSYILDRIYKFR